MTGKQRLGLAISAIISLAVSTGCSTISGVKSTSASLDGEPVVVHHISFQGALRDKGSQATVIDEQLLDNEIKGLVRKLGLGQDTQKPKKAQKKRRIKKQKITSALPSIKRAKYNTKSHKVVLRKAVVTRHKVSLHKPAIIYRVAKQPVEAVALSVFEREVNRLYTSEKTVATPQQVSRNSLWPRLISGYRLSSGTERPLVQKILNQCAKNSKNLNRMFQRSGKYLHFILHELSRRRMPTELALLPMVESAYDNKMTSRTGGAGLWQLTPHQGKQFGLKQTRHYDARMDVFASTRATLDTLQRLNKKFKGDWYLTLASYKLGEKRVQYEIEKNRSSNKPMDYWHLNLPQNTVAYIPKLLAYREILLRPHAYGLSLPVVTNAPQVMRVVVNKSIDLHKTARAASLPASTLADLNLNFKNAITNPRLSKQVVLPRRYASQLHQSIRLAPSVVTVSYKPKTQVKRYTLTNKNKVKNHLVSYRVRAGENLYKIALRHGTTVTKIMRLNKMQNTGIKVGENLKIAPKSLRKKTA
ncbi:MAG: transglycosylase SLT domain-containing protein [Cocleimonas sp.]|nr:transglycosylase SLT domain-containing protein [Cocleimonas sp.]